MSEWEKATPSIVCTAVYAVEMSGFGLTEVKPT